MAIPIKIILMKLDANAIKLNDKKLIYIYLFLL